jgi:carboxymethylenebutenolidase
MCFDVDSEPPVPRISGAAVSHEHLTLTAADGNAFTAFLATPEAPAASGIVVYPDVRGLYRFYEELALRFAERGHAAIAFDCFGGRAAWVGAASGHGLAGAVGFYGSPTRERGGPSVVDRAAEMACPILALQAGDDASIGAEDNAALDRALTAAGVEHEVVVYEGAPHSFFDRKQEEFADASEDAFARTLAFIAQHA